ncbi:MAG: histidinol-phosphatase HisJ family protein [Clostridiales bacterium]|nr:histidinol-phosphatase HisJ family protein [Clostridiales bacterium]
MNKKTIKMDLHSHSTYSYDGRSTMEEYITEAIKNKVDVLCFTDHAELMSWFRKYYVLHYDKYFDEFKRLKEKYEGKIKLLIGMEFGMPNVLTEDFDYATKYDFDMIIGSMHRTIDGNPAFDDGSVSKLHYESTLLMVEHGGFDVLGHLDVHKRYGFKVVESSEIEKEIYKACIKNNIVPEINTSTFRMGMDEAMPTMSSLELYKSLGGKFVTVGTDSHSAETVGTNFERVIETLPDGINLCYFEKRKIKTDF